MLQGQSLYLRLVLISSKVSTEVRLLSTLAILRDLRRKVIKDQMPQPQSSNIINEMYSITFPLTYICIFYHIWHNICKFQLLTVCWIAIFTKTTSFLCHFCCTGTSLHNRLTNFVNTRFYQFSYFFPSSRPNIYCFYSSIFYKIS